jgi:hypothetical protein
VAVALAAEHPKGPERVAAAGERDDLVAELAHTVAVEPPPRLQPGMRLPSPKLKFAGSDAAEGSSRGDVS